MTSLMQSRRHAAFTAPKRRVRGFTLIEILVSFAIFAFGMLGAAGLQLWSLKASQQSNNHAIAAAAVRDFADLMLATPDGIYSTHLAVGTTAVVGSRTVSNPFYFNYTNTEIAALTGGVAADKCFSTTCTDPGDMVLSGIRDWLKRLNDTLPKVRVKVCKDSTPTDDNGGYRWRCDDLGKTTVIKLRWQVNSKVSTSGETLVEQPLAQGESAAEQAITNNRPPTVIVIVTGTVEDSYNNL